MKKSFFLVFLLVFTVFLGACSKQSEKIGSASDINENGFRRPDFGQPERDADFRGLVSNVLGNEVTILKFERPEREDGEMPDFMNQQKNGEDNQEREEGQALSFSGTETRMPGMGGGPGRGEGMRGEVSDEQRAEMLQTMKEMSSGQEKIIIPVGIQMLKRGDADDGKQPEMVEASLENIKTDTMITVWLNKEVEDRKVAEFVLVMN